MSRASVLLPSREPAPLAAVTAVAVILAWASLAAADGAVVKGVIQPFDQGLDGRTRVQETVIRLVPESETAAPEAAEARVELRHGRFVPRVVAVPVGSSVEFVNRDEHIHNVVSRSSLQDFDLGLTDPGESARVVFEHAGAVRVISKAEAPMEGWVFVAPTPWFAVADSEGAWEVRGLPVGSYTAEAWNPHYEILRSPVYVRREGEVVHADFRFTKRR